MRLPTLALAAFVAACSPSAAEETTTTEAAVTTTTTTTPTLTAPATTAAPDTTATTLPDPVRVTVTGGQVDAVATHSVRVGETVLIEVLTDVADEVHVHGYDLFFDTTPGEVTLVEFVADVPGIFEIELESTHLLLLYLEVTP